MLKSEVDFASRAAGRISAATSVTRDGAMGCSQLPIPSRDGSRRPRRDTPRSGPRSSVQGSQVLASTLSREGGTEVEVPVTLAWFRGGLLAWQQLLACFGEWFWLVAFPSLQNINAARKLLEGPAEMTRTL